MTAEKAFEEYKNNPKWQGKIFMQDEKTCFIDGFKIAVDKLKCCGNCKHRRYMGNEIECKIGECNNDEKWEMSD